MWRDVVGYEGIYKVNEHGVIKSFQRIKGEGKVMRPRVRAHGYLEVTLTNKGKKKYMLVHRIVAEAFVSNDDCKPQVNHIDENKLNNHISNLEWVTAQENCNYGTRIKRCVSAHDYSAMAKKNNKRIIQLDKEGKTIKVWESIKACALATGYDASNLVKCCKGKMKTSYGYLWEYK